MIETSAVSSVIASRRRVGRHDPARVERQHGRLPSTLRERLERVEDRLVLDARRDQVLPSGHLERLRDAPNREVIGLGTAAGEDDFRRFGAD